MCLARGAFDSWTRPPLPAIPGAASLLPAGRCRGRAVVPEVVAAQPRLSLREKARHFLPFLPLARVARTATVIRVISRVTSIYA